MSARLDRSAMIAAALALRVVCSRGAGEHEDVSRPRVRKSQAELSDAIDSIARACRFPESGAKSLEPAGQ
jgi:hypothetical protein